MNPEITGRVRETAVDGQLPCLTAFALAKSAGVPPTDIGHAANEADVRIVYCQLDLFGYHPFGGKRLAIPLAEVPPALADAVRTAAEGNQLSCAAAWGIATALGIPRPILGQAAEVLGIRIVSCQLGCF